MIRRAVLAVTTSGLIASTLIAGPQTATASTVTTAVSAPAKKNFTGASLKVTGLPKGAKAPVRITKKVKKRTKTVKNLRTAGGRVALKPGKYALVMRSFTHNGATYLPAKGSATFRVRAKKATSLTAAYSITSGTLTVNATGLPIGAQARIRIVGDGVDDTVQAVTFTRDLPAGQYRIEALPVDIGGAEATPVAGPQTVTVAAGRPTVTTVAYETPATGARSVPGRVAQIQADPGQNAVKLTWTEASAPPGAPVQSHRITVWKNDTKVDTQTAGPGQSFTVKVTGGQRYRFAVAAGNANGYGEESPVSLEVVPILMEYKSAVAIVDPLTVVGVNGTSDTGGTVTVTGTAPAANSVFVIEPSTLVPGGLTGRVQYLTPDGQGQTVMTFAPVSSLDVVIEDYKIDVKNVPFTGAPAQQAMSARQYMRVVRKTGAPLEFGCELEDTPPMEWTSDIDIDLDADWDEKYFKLLVEGDLGISVDFLKVNGGSWSCSITIPAGVIPIGAFLIEQDIVISASLSVPSLDIPGGDVGLDLAVQAGFEKNGDSVTDLSDVSATPRLAIFDDGPEEVVAEPSANASMQSEYSGKFLSVAGLSLSAGPSLTATIHLFQTATCYSLTIGYDIGASIELGKWGVEWSMDLFDATVFETDLVNTCDKVWTGPVKVLWEAQGSSYTCPWSYVCGWYPPGSEINDLRTYSDSYTLTLSAIDANKPSQPGVGQRPASITGKGTQTSTQTRWDWNGGNPVTYPWCNATVTTEPDDFTVQRKYAFTLSPLERVGPGKLRWYVSAPGVSGSPGNPGETGNIIATRNVTFQHPDYSTYEGCGRSGVEGPASWASPWHSYSQQPNWEIIDTDPDPKRLVGTYSFESGPKKAVIEVDLTLEDRLDPP